MKLRTGKLDREITISRLTETVGESGNVTKNWMPIHTVRAEKVEFTSEDNLEAFGNVEAGKVAFRLHYVDGISVADRVFSDGVNFEIEGITELGRRHGLELRGVQI